MEAGFAPGDSLVLFVDQTASAENIVTQMGAAKAGVSIVTFDEKESADALEHALASTKAKGLIFSPDSQVTEEKTRADVVNSLAPELSKMYPGQALNLAKFPSLKHIVQTGHNAMRGVNKFRDLPVYARPTISSRQIPTNEPMFTSHVALQGGQKVASFTSGEMVDYATELWDSYLNMTKTNEHAIQPVFMSADLETPFGFASLLACTSNLKKLFIPASFNMSKMLKSVPRQHSTFLICDEDFFNLEVPPAK